MTDLALMGVVLFFSAFAQGATGLGFALIAGPVIGLVQASLLPVILLIQMVPLNAYIAWRERHHLDRRGVSWVNLGRIIGTFGGLWVLFVVTGHVFNLLVGISTVVAVLATWFAPPFNPGRGAFTTAGFVTGVTETATGIGGPPLALVYQYHSPSALRASVAVCFLFGELVSLVILGVTGVIKDGQIQTAFLLLPAVIIGVWASRLTHHRLEGKLMRHIVLGIALISGIVVTVQGL